MKSMKIEQIYLKLFFFVIDKKYETKQFLSYKLEISYVGINYASFAIVYVLFK